MELEELKKAWNTFDPQLQQQDMLKAILKDSLVNKSDKGLSRMINYGYFGLTIMVLGLFVCIWAVFQFPDRPLTIRIGLYMTVIFVLYGIIQGVIGLSKLLKIDFSSSIKENMQKISSYRVWYHKQLIIILVSVSILVIPVIIDLFTFEKAQTWKWFVLFGALGVGAVGTWWEYKQMYQKNIQSIQKSLEELEELKELDMSKT